MDRAALRTQIADEVNRPTLLTSGMVDTCIAAAEAEFARELRLREMMVAETATIASGEDRVSLPTDWLAPAHLMLTTSPISVLGSTDLTGVMSERARVGSGGTGRPTAYAIVGDEIWIGPVADAAYTIQMVYYQTIPALSASVTSNWLLAKHPDLYLYASLKHTAPYLHQDARLATWTQLAGSVMESVQRADWNLRAAATSGPLQMRSRSFG